MASLTYSKDHGWCGRYTCQEWILIFHSLIAPGLNYEIALSSTNLRNMRFYLLYAKESDAIRIAFVYTNPQRLDVYYHSVMGTLLSIQPLLMKMQMENSFFR